jgi:hypothetical protein
MLNIDVPFVNCNAARLTYLFGLLYPRDMLASLNITKLAQCRSNLRHFEKDLLYFYITHNSGWKN